MANRCPNQPPSVQRLSVLAREGATKNKEGKTDKKKQKQKKNQKMGTHETWWSETVGPTHSSSAPPRENPKNEKKKKGTKKTKNPNSSAQSAALTSSKTNKNKTNKKHNNKQHNDTNTHKKIKNNI